MTERAAGQIKPPTSLGELRLTDTDLDTLVGEIGRLAIDGMDGWIAAAASVVQRDRVATFGTSDVGVNSVDQAQYDAGRGPCVDAIKDGESQYFDGNEIPARWRQVAEAAAEAGIYSILSFPLRVDGEVLGGLNFYSNERDALRLGQREEGLLFASQAAVTIANAQAYQGLASQVDQLEQALQTRTMIGQATGLLMAHEGLTSEEAFQKLVQVSQTSNLKLRDIAERFVTAWEQKRGEPVN